MLRIDEEINVFVFAKQQCIEEAKGSECLSHEPGDAENVALTWKWCPSGYSGSIYTHNAPWENIMSSKLAEFF